MSLRNGWKIDKSNPDTERFHLNKVLKDIDNSVTQIEEDITGLEPTFSKGDLVEGSNVTLTGDLTGRLVGAGNITISASGGGGTGTVDSVVAGTGIAVDATDPANPEVALSAGSVASLALADTAVQPGDNVSTLTNDAGYTTNAGTVTSVGLTTPTGLSVAGSPVTTSGTLAVTYSAGYVGYTTAEASKLAGIGDGANVTSVNGQTGVAVLDAGDVGAEPAFSKGDLIQGANVTLTGTLTDRLVGSGDVTISADAGGAVDTVTAGTGIAVDSSDPANPEVALSSGSIASLGLADSAVQPGDLATVATTGAYSDLTGLPTLGTAAAEDVGYFATAAQGALADTALQTAVLTVVAGTNITVDDTDPENPIISASAASGATLPSVMARISLGV